MRRELSLPGLFLLSLGASCSPGDSGAEALLDTAVTVSIGAGKTCASQVRSVDLVVSASGHETSRQRFDVKKITDLPITHRLEAQAARGTQHEVEVIFGLQTGAAALSVALAMTLPAGSTGHVGMTLPCACIGVSCPGETACAELPQGTGNTRCVAVASCGDGACEAGESAEVCPADCGASCGDGECSADESCGTCAADCGLCLQCGDGKCSAGESCASCPADCKASCALGGAGGAAGGSGQAGGGGVSGGSGQASGGGVSGGSGQAGAAGGGGAGGISGGSGQGGEGGMSGGSGPGGEAGSAGQGGGGAPPDPCVSLSDTGDPGQNLAALVGCLGGGHATVVSPEYPVSDGFTMPPGSTLTGQGKPTIRLVSCSTNHVVSLEGGATLAGVRLDAAGKLPSGANEAVAHVAGAGNVISGCYLGHDAPYPAGSHPVGVYFIDGQASGNRVEDTDIAHNFYGAIFVAGLDASHVNEITGSRIFDHACDGVTFAGYGQLTKSKVYENGFDCGNGPIPGASVYGLGNDLGALIDQNELTEDCGNVIDLDSVSGFVITSNQVRGPGNQWGGKYPWCGGGAAIAVIDSSRLTITGNVATNEGRPQNRLQSDPNGVFTPPGGPTSGDLPAGTSTTVAFWLGRRPGDARVVNSNTIAGNEFRASCDGDCSGVGYFISRRTGVDPAGNWSAETTSYFTSNNPFGSNVGSRRCGANWYAANSACVPPDLEPECNEDDPQHQGGPGFDWSRNDNCK